MHRRLKVAILAAALTAVVVAGAAIGATKVLTPKQEGQAVIDDAAKQLGVAPSELSNALKQALKNRVDAAVNDGLLTKEQGAELKNRIDAGELPLFGLGRGFDGPGWEHHKIFPGLDAAADYLGMTEAQLRDALANGKSLAQVARDRGKSVDGLVNAMLADAKEKLDAAVKAGRLTQAERNDMVAGLQKGLTDLVNGRLPMLPPGGFGGPGFGHHKIFPGLDAAADYLGMTEAQLHDALADGKSLAQVARDRGKSVDGLVNAMLADAKEKLDAAVKAGRLTQAERNDMVAGLQKRVRDLVNGRFPEPPQGGFRHFHRFGPDGPERPDAFRTF